MILVCPSCASTHHIARQLLGAKGRQVRCAQCRSVWFQAPADGAEAEALPPTIAVEAQSERPDELPRQEEPRCQEGRQRLDTPRRSVEPRRSDEWPLAHMAANENLPPITRLRRHHRWGRVGGVALAGAVAAALMAGVAQREAIVRFAPAMQALYAAIGLPVNLRGLDLRTIKSTLLEDGAQHVIAVTGEIANLRGVAQAVPGVRVALRSADGREVYNWTAPPPKARLAAGETVVFRTRLADPPSGARDVVVQFAEVLGASAGKDAR